MGLRPLLYPDGLSDLKIEKFYIQSSCIVFSYLRFFVINCYLLPDYAGQS